MHKATEIKIYIRLALVCNGTIHWFTRQIIMKYGTIFTRDEQTGKIIGAYLDIIPESLSAEDPAKFDSALEQLKKRRNKSTLN